MTCKEINIDVMNLVRIIMNHTSENSFRIFFYHVGAVVVITEIESIESCNCRIDDGNRDFVW